MKFGWPSRVGDNLVVGPLMFFLSCWNKTMYLNSCPRKSYREKGLICVGSLFLQKFTKVYVRNWEMFAGFHNLFVERDTDWKH